MEKLPKVLVIMSTYNGEKFIREQIDSILAQESVDVTIHIFDDCSKDSTQEIAKEYEKKDKRVVLHINEKNKNFTYNFIDGLFTFKDEQKYDYYAFADQDDYWMPNKLISAVNKIKEVGKCTLYCSNLKLVDSELNGLGKTMIDMRWKKGEYKYSHYDELCYNFVTGCTVVFDNDFKNLATKYYPTDLYYHDYWFGLIANYVKGAKFIYDNCPYYILYRQHGNNLVGAQKFSFFYRIYRFLFKKDEVVPFFLRKFYDIYKDEIDEKDRLIIDKFINYRKLKNKIYLSRNVKCNFSRKLKLRLYFNKFK